MHKPANVYYLSGFSGEGLLLLGQGMRTIITDFRYVEDAQRQAPGWQVLSIRPGLSHLRIAAQQLGAADIWRLLFEDDCVTVRQHAEMRDLMPKVEMGPLGRLPEKLRQIKDQDEQARMARACEISCQAFDWILGEVAPGMTEREIRRKLDFRMLELGADSPGFSTIVASGPNGSLPHAVPGDRQAMKGDMVTLDFGARYRGYCADMTRTFALGEPDGRMREVYEIVSEAQHLAQEALRPGEDCRAIDSLARDLIAGRGYGDHFGHGLGHAVGLDIHEDPRLSQTSGDQLAPGMGHRGRASICPASAGASKHSLTGTARRW